MIGLGASGAGGGGAGVVGAEGIGGSGVSAMTSDDVLVEVKEARVLAVALARELPVVPQLYRTVHHEPFLQRHMTQP